MAGVTATGFITKRIAEIQTDLTAAFRAVFGQGIKTSPDTQFGKIIGIMADREASVWEMAESVYNSQYPSSATDAALNRVAEITAISRNPAIASTVTAYLAGTSGTTIPAGTLFTVINAGDQFKTLSAVVLSGSQFAITSLTRSGNIVTAAATAHGRPVGGRAIISGAIQTEYNGVVTVLTVPNANSFTYAVTTTPTTPATGTFVGDPATAAACESVFTGPVVALAKTLTQIVNTVSGLNRVENQTDALLGRNVETDTELRARRLLALKGLGAARLEAIRGALLQITGVSQAKVFENATGLTDPATGRPPNSIECLVQGGADATIFGVVWDKKAAGIEPFGNINGIVADSQGVTHISKFSRPTLVPIYLILDLTVIAGFPGTQVVIDRILAYEATLLIGDDVIVSPALISSFGDVPGITGVVVKIGTSPGPTLSANIIVAQTSLADFDTSRITINLL